ncbi:MULTISPECIES: REP-associated tyrosine transposase [Pseudomonas]|uniref:REP-associated tyrosine transposase n=1 Tax=Pseudomonas TaxID=286 RepID=UPI0018AB0EEF|nr:transposase [Pseudomonas guariconensis]MBF8743360.1 transposase [Pseudomonas guariconensis]MBF8752906.1 transposase [Pseudomonas guariconensis]MBF8795288.1 transposase [Pseudomonas monteilii]
MERPHSRLLRCGRYSEPGRLYLLTTATLQRKPLFLNFHYARLAIHQLRQAEEEKACHSLAWVIMPDHIHWLIELRTGTLSALMRRFKSRSSRGLYEAGYRERIWQPGYQDRALRRDDDVRRVARYIIANPIRAGLVRRVGAYSHWDAVWL